MRSFVNNPDKIVLHLSTLSVLWEEDEREASFLFARIQDTRGLCEKNIVKQQNITFL